MTRSIGILEQVIQSKGDLVELESTLGEFETRFSNLDSIQEKIEMLLDENSIEEDVCKAAEVRERALECKVSALRAVQTRARRTGPRR